MMVRGLAILATVIAAAALADVLAHPQGTTAAGNSIIGILKPSLQAASGQKIS